MALNDFIPNGVPLKEFNPAQRWLLSTTMQAASGESTCIGVPRRSRAIAEFWQTSFAGAQ